HPLPPLAGELLDRDQPGHRRPHRTGAAAGGILLVARYHKARTHRTAVELSAGTVPIAELHGSRETAVGREVELLLDGNRAVGGSEAQVLGHRRRVHNPTRIEQAVRIADPLDLPVHLVQFAADQWLDCPGARDTVTVLRGN